MFDYYLFQFLFVLHFVFPFIVESVRFKLIYCNIIQEKFKKKKFFGEK